MKTLIVEDDFTSRLLLQELLKSYGPFHIAVNGKEAIDAVRLALEAGEPYDLICMDIMMPELDGKAALRAIRDLEGVTGITYIPAPRGAGAKVIMTTALNDPQNVVASFNELCDAYIIKPIDKLKLLNIIRSFGLPG